MSDGAFLGYILLLTLSGILLLALGAGGFGQSVGARLVDGLFGIVFLGYAFYLFFVFDGGEVAILFYAFIVPVVAVIQAVKAYRTRRASATGGHAPFVAGPPLPGQAPHPFGQPQPGQAPHPFGQPLPPTQAQQFPEPPGLSRNP